MNNIGMNNISEINLFDIIVIISAINIINQEIHFLGNSIFHVTEDPESTFSIDHDFTDEEIFLAVLDESECININNQEMNPPTA